MGVGENGTPSVEVRDVKVPSVFRGRVCCIAAHVSVFLGLINFRVYVTIKKLVRLQVFRF